MKRRSAFTLIEILIVVIILGILAAIVIPQFANASEDAKLSAVQSTVQSVRSQMGLFALQHGDSQLDNSNVWSGLITASVYGGKTVGPYMQSVPVNPFNQSSSVGGAPTGTGAGWAISANKFYGLGKGGTWEPKD